MAKPKKKSKLIPAIGGESADRFHRRPGGPMKDKKDRRKKEDKNKLIYTEMDTYEV